MEGIISKETKPNNPIKPSDKSRTYLIKYNKA